MLWFPHGTARGVRWLVLGLLVGLSLRGWACWQWREQLREDRDLYVLLARQLIAGRGYSRPWQISAAPPPRDTPWDDEREPRPRGGDAEQPPPPVRSPRPGETAPRGAEPVRVLSPHGGSAPGTEWELSGLALEKLPQPDGGGVIHLPTAYRPPLYPLLLAGALAVWDSHVAVGVLNGLLGGVTLAAIIWAGWGLGRESGRPLGTAVAALGWVACDPVLVAQTPLAMTETLAATLVAVWLALVAPPNSVRRRFATGLWMGLLVLCRPTFLVVAAVWVAWLSIGWLPLDRLCRGWLRRDRLWLARSRQSGGREEGRLDWRSLCGLCGGAALLVAPWGLRNALQFGSPIITTTHGGYTLRLAQNERYARLVARSANPQGWRDYNALIGGESPGWMYQPASATSRVRVSAAGRLAYSGHWTRWERDSDQELRARGSAHLRESVSGSVATARSLLARFWSLWPRQSETWPPLARWGLGLQQGLLFAAAAAGGIAWCRGPGGLPAGVRLALALVVGLSLVHAVYWSDLRMRVPLVPALALLAARPTLQVGEWLLGGHRTARGRLRAAASFGGNPDTESQRGVNSPGA